MTMLRSYLPGPRPRIVEVRDTMYLLFADGSAHQLSGDSAELARCVLDFSAAPRSRQDVVAHLEAQAGEPLPDPAVLDQLLDALVRAGALGEVDGDTVPVTALPAARNGVRVLLCLTGAVASAQAPELAGQLLAAGFDVRVALTPSARNFVTVAALEAVTHAKVATDLWNGRHDEPATHITLAEWADVVLVCPASATTIARIAHGDCSELVAATCIATRAPLVVVPSMNENMLRAPAVARNLSTLRNDGVYVVRSGHGIKLAHAPERRAPSIGPGPGPAAVVKIVELVTAMRRAERSAAWESQYAGRTLSDVPWFFDGMDPDLEAPLAKLGLDAGHGRSLLDVGTGPGSIAIELARRGFVVTATDISPSAVRAARQRPGAAVVDWQVDDITRSRVAGAFDVVLDRGCLHFLDAEGASAWSVAMHLLVAARGLLIVKCFADDVPGARRYAAADLAAMLGPAFRLVGSETGTFRSDGVAEPAAALIACFRR